MRYNHLPTLTNASWTVTGLLDSLQQTLASDTAGDTLRLFSYAVTTAGWQEISQLVNSWMQNRAGRSVVAYVGTDHALTDPEALRQMICDDMEVRLMTRYRGVFHPKVFWLRGQEKHVVWVGSNNLTSDGLRQNIEFSTLIISNEENSELQAWFEAVHEGSDIATEQMICHYETERRQFARGRAQTGTFTWTNRTESSSSSVAVSDRRNFTPTAHVGQPGDLVVEIMPLETGLDGKQIQLPKASVVSFFGLDDRIGASRQIGLTHSSTRVRRVLTMTIFANNTARLSINELDYRDRPCVMLFRSTADSEFQFEIIRQSIYPDRYRDLLLACRNQTRAGSRRWTIL